MNFPRSKMFASLMSLMICTRVMAGPAQFSAGVAALRAGNYAGATSAFRGSLVEQTSSGALLNLGLAEWRQGRVGVAVLSWEQAAWLNPLDDAARNNLQFARQAAQLDAPELTWYESASAWLPAVVWAWIASASLWLTVAMLVLPGVLRARKAGWHQAVAACGLGVFLLSLAPNLGVVTRANLGIVLEKNAALRLTPTTEGEPISSLTAGDSVRKLRDRGDYSFVRTPRGTGWIERRQLGMLTQYSN